MRRGLSLWLALLAAYWLTRAAVSSLLVGRVEHGFPELVELLAVPALQALVLSWATRQRGAVARLALPWREAWRLWPLRGVLAMDLGVIAVAWLVPAPRRPAWLAPSFRAGLPAWLAAAQLLAAAALLAVALREGAWRLRERLAAGAVAAGLLAAAADPWSGWLGALPGLLVPAAAAAPSSPSMALGWFGVYGALLAAALLLVMEAAAALRRRCPPAAQAFDQALVLLLGAAAVAAIGFVQRRHGADDAPWNRAAACMGFVSAVAFLVGAALAAHVSRAAAAERRGAARAAPAVAPASPAPKGAALALADEAGSGPPPPYHRPRRPLRPARGRYADTAVAAAAHCGGSRSRDGASAGAAAAAHSGGTRSRDGAGPGGELP